MDHAMLFISHCQILEARSSESTHIVFSVFESVWGLGRKFLAVTKKVYFLI